MKTSDKIIRLMKELRMDQKYVARSARIAYNTFRSYLREGNPSIPSVDIAKRICSVLNVSVDWLFDDEKGWPPDDAALHKADPYEAVKARTREISKLYSELFRLFRELRTGLDALKEDGDVGQRDHVVRIMEELFSLSCENETKMRDFEQFWFDLHKPTPYSDLGLTVPDMIELMDDLDNLGIATPDEYPEGFLVWSYSYRMWAAFLRKNWQRFRRRDALQDQLLSAKPNKPKPRTTGKKSAPAKPQRPKRPRRP